MINKIKIILDELEYNNYLHEKEEIKKIKEELRNIVVEKDYSNFKENGKVNTVGANIYISRLLELIGLRDDEKGFIIDNLNINY